MREAELQQVWAEQRGLSWPQRLSDGRVLRVLYPGRRRGGRGPDFGGAVLLIGRRRVQGDVELHLHRRDWRGHGHENDAAYAGVVLHVLWHREDAGRSEAAGPPVLALSPFARCDAPGVASGPAPWDRACRLGVEALGLERLRHLLARLGLARFRSRAGILARDMAVLGSDQAAYQALMTALGYCAYQEAFQRTARALPLAAFPASEGQEAILACLLGVAGLLEPPEGLVSHWTTDRCYRRLLALWRARGLRQALPSAAWWGGQGRPTASPWRKMASAAALIHRHGSAAFFASLLGAFTSTSPSSPLARLRAALVVRDGGYWAAYRAFAAPLRRPLPTLLGRGRADIVAVNALLPLFYAHSALESRPRLMAAALEGYLSLAPLEENAVTREMRRQLASAGAEVGSLSACQQQGLHHLFEGWCARRRCAACPVASPT